MNFLSVSDLNLTFDAEPRVAHTKLAVALNYSQQHKLRHLVERNTGEFERYGRLPSTMDESTGGRFGQIIWLNEGQAILAAVKSNTDRAAEVRHQVITVFMAYRHGQSLVPVRAHERRQSTSTEVALRLKTNVDRLEKILLAHERAAALDTVLQMARDVHAQHERVMQDTARTVEAMGIIARG